MKHQPKNIQVLLGKGISLYETKKYEQAALLLSQAYDIDSNNFEVVFNYGVCNF